MSHEFHSKHVAFGVLPTAEFNAETELLPLDRPCQLIVCSDGATEAETADGTPFGSDSLLATLRGVPASLRLDRLKQDLAKHLSGRRAIDDISVAMVDCIPSAPLPG